MVDVDVDVDMDVAPESCGPRHRLTSVHFPPFFGAGIEPSTSTSPELHPELLLHLQPQYISSLAQKGEK